jgi:NAD(P)-dependent dehydrogenase (short-subunit alcohol dehydrogenase family)
MALEATIRTFGSVNIMCCFAGVVGCTPSVDVKAEEWKRVMDINCNGVFLCAQAAGRYVMRPSPFKTAMEALMADTEP